MYVPSHGSLHDIRVGDGKQTARDRVGPDNNGAQPNGQGLVNAPHVGTNNAHTHQVTGEEHEEGGNRNESHQDFHDLSVTTRKDVGEREDAFFGVDLSGE
jgi:hypothetical protein